MARRYLQRNMFVHTCRVFLKTKIHDNFLFVSKQSCGDLNRYENKCKNKYTA